MKTRSTRNTRAIVSSDPPTVKSCQRFVDFIRLNDTKSVRKWFRKRQIPGSDTLGSQFPQYLSDPVFEAVAHGNFVIFNLLVHHGFQLDRMTRWTYWESYERRSVQPIHVAARRGDIKIVKKLIGRCDIPVDTWDSLRGTPLMYAVYGTRIAVVKYLLYKGADVNCCSSKMYASPPLLTAISEGNTELADLLLKHGANINQDIPKEGCLLNVSVDCENLPMVEWLHKNGARTDICGTEGNTNFHYAMNRRFSIKMLQFLIGINVPLNQLTSEGHTALDGVLLANYPPNLSDCLTLIVDAGFRVTLKDYEKACQIWTTDTDLLLVKQLQSYLSHPRSLQQLCCFAIREILGLGLPKRVYDLPVPTTIIEYLKLDHLVNS